MVVGAGGGAVPVGSADFAAGVFGAVDQGVQADLE